MYPEKKQQNNYPAHWWTPIHDPKKPEWEILPQEVRFPEVILSKRHELGILSNFSETPFEFHGVRYRSVEGFWQMMFFDENSHRRAEVSQMIGLEACLAGEVDFQKMKSAGLNAVTFEGRKLEYWTSKKGEHYDLIVEVMRTKLAQNPRVREVLLSTGNLILKPDHFQPADAPPSWRYFEIWMSIRSGLV